MPFANYTGYLILQKSIQFLLHANRMKDNSKLYNMALKKVTMGSREVMTTLVALLRL